MKKVFTLLTVVLTALSARTTSGAYGTFGPALAIVNYNQINATFQRFGVSKLSSLHWMYGGGGYVLINRTFIGGAGWTGTQSVSSESLNLFCEVNYGWGEFRTGYVLLDLKHLLLVPGVGIGGGGYSINLGPYNQKIPSFDSLVANPGRTSTVNFSGFSLNPQLTAIIPISFVGLELRGGYNIGPLGGSWKLEDRGVLSRGPEMSKANPWFSFNILIGGFSHEKKTKMRIQFEGQSEPQESPELEKTPVEEK